MLAIESSRQAQPSILRMANVPLQGQGSVLPVWGSNIHGPENMFRQRPQDPDGLCTQDEITQIIRELPKELHVEENLEAVLVEPQQFSRTGVDIQLLYRVETVPGLHQTGHTYGMIKLGKYSRSDDHSGLLVPEVTKNIMERHFQPHVAQLARYDTDTQRYVGLETFHVVGDYQTPCQLETNNHFTPGEVWSHDCPFLLDEHRLEPQFYEADQRLYTLDGLHPRVEDTVMCAVGSTFDMPGPVLNSFQHLDVNEHVLAVLFLPLNVDRANYCAVLCMFGLIPLPGHGPDATVYFCTIFHVRNVPSDFVRDMWEAFRMLVISMVPRHEDTTNELEHVNVNGGLSYVSYAYKDYIVHTTGFTRRAVGFLETWGATVDVPFVGILRR